MKIDISKYDSTYCGMMAEARDHIIPVAYAYASRKTASWGKDKIVPACKECNSLLSDLWIITIQDRASYIAGALSSRYKALLQSPDWAYQEISSLGYVLKTDVVGKQNLRTIARIRIAYAMSMSKTELKPEDIWDISKEQAESIEAGAKKEKKILIKKQQDFSALEKLLRDFRTALTAKQRAISGTRSRQVFTYEIRNVLTNERYFGNIQNPKDILRDARVRKAGLENVTIELLHAGVRSDAIKFLNKTRKQFAAQSVPDATGHS